MSKKPFFSVVMPTRNRAELLAVAVRSVLNQTFDDFELIISDNFSSDQTAELARHFNEDRIRYYRSERSLSMADSWEFALSHASGEYVCFLADDDAYAKVFLQKMLQTVKETKAEIVTAKLAPYYAVDAFEYGENITKNSLIIEPFDRKIHMLDQKESLTLLFSKFRLAPPLEKHKPVNIPQLVNSTYHSSLIKKIKSRIDRIFPVVASDIYSSALFLNAVQKYCYIDEPLYLHAKWEGSETAGEKSLFEKNPEERKMNYVPLKKMLSPFNYGANVILRAKADWGPDFYAPPVDFSFYFPPLFDELKYLEANNIDVSAELKEFESVLAEQDEAMRTKVARAISGNKLFVEAFKAKVKNTVLGKIALKLKNRKLKVLSSFENIAQCAEIIDENFLEKNSGKGK